MTLIFLNLIAGKKMMASIYQMARQRIAGATIKTPTKKVTL